ncbi:MAG TPA: hypothetical protein VIH27_01115 [Nitrososphaerales archaeon]
MPIRVVAIDDDSDILRMVRTKLVKEGFEVITASDGEEGLSKVLVEKTQKCVMSEEPDLDYGILDLLLKCMAEQLKYLAP